MVIEDKTMFTVEEVLESSPVTKEDDFMVNGVRFIEVEDEETGDVTFYHVDDEEIVSMIPLEDPRDLSDPNYTFARLEETGEKVMVDDDGVHLKW